MKIRIAKELVPVLEAKLEKFRKHCPKASVSYTVSDPIFVSDINDKFFRHNVVIVDITAHYAIEGFDFVAKLEWNKDQKRNIVKRLNESVEIPEMYYTRNYCDHCKTNRARIKTVLLKKDDKFVQVGFACVKDYLGISVEKYAEYLNLFDSLEVYLASITEKDLSKYQPLFSADEILGQTIEEINTYGYVSKKDVFNADKINTTAAVYRILTSAIDPAFGRTFIAYNISDETKQKVAEIKTFISNLDDSSDYNKNLKVLNQSETITKTNIALLSSAVGYKMKVDAEKKEKESKPISEYVGNIGDKIEFTGLATCVYSGDSYYGMVNIYKFIINNNIITWATGKKIPTDREITISGRIKAFTEYKGDKQTSITRCKVVD